LAEFCAESSSEVRRPDAKNKRRDVIDAFRAVLWARGVQLEIAASGPVDIARKLEPEVFFRNKQGRLQHPNNWRAYLCGERTPSRALIQRIEERIPGSSTLTNHVVWDAMRVRTAMKGRAIELSWRLSDRLKQIVAPQIEARVRNQQVPELSDEQQESIDAAASLEALACLLILIREAAEEGRLEYAAGLMPYMGSMLLSVSLRFINGGVLDAIGDYFDDEIFPLAANESGLCHQFMGIRLVRAAGHLLHRLHHIKGLDPSGLSEDEQAVVLQRILNANYGFEYPFALNPLPIQTNVTGPAVLESNLDRLRTRVGALLALTQCEQFDFDKHELLDAEWQSVRMIAMGYMERGTRFLPLLT
jgi:hypothetical protein